MALATGVRSPIASFDVDSTSSASVSKKRGQLGGRALRPTGGKIMTGAHRTSATRTRTAVHAVVLLLISASLSAGQPAGPPLSSNNEAVGLNSAGHGEILRSEQSAEQRDAIDSAGRASQRAHSSSVHAAFGAAAQARIYLSRVQLEARRLGLERIDLDGVVR